MTEKASERPVSTICVSCSCTRKYPSRGIRALKSSAAATIHLLSSVMDFWSRVGGGSTSAVSLATFPSSVAPPVAKASAVARPLRTVSPAKTTLLRSATGAPSWTTAPADLSTGFDSPVSEDSSTSRL